MNKYIVLDFEMCMVPRDMKEFPYSSEIIEIGAVALEESLKITDSFKCYVTPQYGRLNPYIETLTGITSKHLNGAPTIHEAIESFFNWIPENSIFVSWSDSDKYQLQKELELKGISIPGTDDYFDSWIDCQKIFSEKMDTDKAYRLSEALIIADIDYDENLHDGLSDAENTAKLFAKMKKEKTLKLSSYYTKEEDSFLSCQPFADLFKKLGTVV